ncbi:unnamed protein product [Pseudo-nitzschia multistriata]|uniref:Uncharacterized protein n=1 Tax=Pseudo-nitzschia multistriata TaxID=183589 RepID=A0A448Z3H5_9STRA|nr:unnamed protein product [Pseudo-nitzschia multistriata]
MSGGTTTTASGPSHSGDQLSWARDTLSEWGEASKSNSVIYTYAFVTFLTLAKTEDGGEGQDDSELVDRYHKNRGYQGSKLGKLAGTALLLVLVGVAIVIQTVTPIAIVATMELPEGGACPNEADGLTKFIGLTLCLYFVFLTISMCQNKLRAMGYLRLFCGHHDAGLGGRMGISCGVLFLDAGILANMLSMGAAGAAQYLLFVRNANRDVLLLLLLQSLAMQFVLTADQKLMTGAWNALTKKQIEILLQKDTAGNKPGGAGGAEESGLGTEAIEIDDARLSRILLMHKAETAFLMSVVLIGGGWSIALTYCM